MGARKLWVRLAGVGAAVTAIAVALSGLAGASGLPAAASGITPTTRQGTSELADCQRAVANPHVMGLKVSKGDQVGAYNGTYTQDTPGVEATHKPNNLLQVTIANAGVVGGAATFAWSATTPVDYVVVKAGTGATVYDYSAYDWKGHPATGPFGDSGLVSPKSSISHVLFCQIKQIRIEKTAVGTVDRAYQWEISKQVSTNGTFGPTATLALSTGTQGSAQWKIVATRKGVTESAPTVAGTITVLNASPFVADVSLVDQLPGAVLDAGCARFSLAIGARRTCGYSAALASATPGTNVAVATAVNHAWMAPAKASAAYDFASTGKTSDARVRWVDSNGKTESGIGDTLTTAYETVAKCDDDKGAHENVVTLYGDGDRKLGQAKATLTVTCAAVEKKLVVASWAKLTWDRETTWSVAKAATPASHSLKPGTTGTSTWSIDVTRGDSRSEYTVSGTVKVTNPNAFDVSGVTVAESLAGAKVACGYAKVDGSVPATIPAGGSLICTFSAKVGSAAAGSTVATVAAAGGLGGTSTAGWAAVAAPNGKDVNATVTAIDTRLGKTWPVTGGEDDRSFAEVFPCENREAVNVVTLVGDDPATASVVETDALLATAQAKVKTACETVPPVTPQPPVTPETPTTPVTPKVPETPVAPPVSVAPVKPVSPVKPISPVKPSKPAVRKPVVKAVVVKKVVEAAPKPKPVVKGKVASCTAVALSTRTVRSGVRSTIGLMVTAGGKPVAGARVRLSGPGILKVVRTGVGGRVVTGVRPSKAGIVTIDVVSKLDCSQRRIGVVASVEPTVTG